MLIKFILICDKMTITCLKEGKRKRGEIRLEAFQRVIIVDSCNRDAHDLRTTLHIREISRYYMCREIVGQMIIYVSNFIIMSMLFIF